MNLNKTKAFIIHKLPYQEYNEIITAICEVGIKKFIVKGIKKQNSKTKVACELGSYTTIEYIEKDIPIIKSAVINQTSFTKDYQSLMITQLICELSYRLEFQNYETMQFLNQLTGYHKLLYFLYHLCKDNGVIFEVNHCVRTKATTNIYALSVEDGGFISKEAFQEKDIVLNKNQFIVLQVLQRVNETTLTKYKELTLDYQTCALYLKLIQQQFNIYSRLEKYLQEEANNGKSI